MTLRVVALASLLALATLAAGPAQARTIGQIIDDATLVAAVKAKITAERLSNLVRIDVKSNDGVVTLNGTVDSLERRDRIVQIASWVEGVKRVVDNIQVTGSGATPSAATPVSSRPAPDGARVDATGRVAAVEPATGTLTLADGRVLGLPEGAVIWQSTTLEALAPGTQVLIRNGAPAAR
jgi:hyperosmotically inducible protein